MQKKNLIEIAAFILMVFVFDASVGFGLKKLYRIQDVGAAGQLNNTFFKTTDEIIILGNSRAQHNYNNKIITQITGMSTCNAGQDGGYGVWLPYASVDAILRRYKPKVILVEFNPASMGYWKGNYDRLTVLLPYIDQFEVCRNLVSKRGKFEKVKWLSSIYPYNSWLYTLAIGKLFENRLKHVMGFIPITNKNINPATDTAAIFNHYSDTSDAFNTTVLDSFLKLGKDNTVKLVFINSPVYAGKSLRLLNQTTAAKAALQKIKEAGFEYWDFTTDQSMVNNPSFFADQVHLNKTGADYFTSLIGEKVNKIVGIHSF